MTAQEGGRGYLAVLRTPQALRAFLPALVGRLSFATVTLSLLLAVRHSSGSYAAAGAAVGIFGLANVLVSPFRARLVDRRGQRVLAGFGIAYAVLLGGLAALSALPTAPLWALLVLSAAAGVCPPPLGPAMRALWTDLIPDPALIVRAYSLDAVAEEVLFTSGPVLIGVVIALSDPALGLATTAVLALTGTLGMTSSQISRAQRTSASYAALRARRLVRRAGFRPLLVTLVSVGVVLGAVEVAAPAFAQRHGAAGAAGPLLASVALASAAGGLLYGRRSWSTPLGPRLSLLAAALIASSGLLALASTIVALAGALLLLGLFFSPTVVTGYLLANELAPAHARVEASSWINTATNAGAAMGSALAGVAVERSGIATAFAGASCLAAVLAASAAHGTVTLDDR